MQIALFDPFLGGLSANRLFAVFFTLSFLNSVLDSHDLDEAHDAAIQRHLTNTAVEELNLDHPGLFTTEHGGMRSLLVEGPGIYFMGIIDVLQVMLFNFWRTLFIFCKACILAYFLLDFHV